MRMNLLSVGLMLAVGALGAVGPVRAQNVAPPASYEEAEESPVSTSVADGYAPEMSEAGQVEAPVDGGQCDNCGQCACECPPQRCWNPPFADPCPEWGLYGFSAIDSFRGLADGTFQNNNGVVTGVNLASAVPWFDRYGIGWQAGGSFAGYDFSGRTSNPPNNSAQTQGFATLGFFRRADADCPISVGFVYDAMINHNFGVWAQSPFLSQFRGQVAYALSASNEIGVWGTIRDHGSTQTTGGVPVSYRAYDQGNLFWHHKYACGGADSWLYVGMPQRNRLGQNDAAPGGGTGSLGSFIVGGNVIVPITNYCSLYSNAMYMKPSARAGVNFAGVDAASQEFWNISFGIAFYPGASARSSTVAGRKWMPYMPVANNGSFMVDTNNTF
jgi:hypothetical protein